MPRISVIVPSLRVGGLDVLCAGLERQTFRDFELVFVDCLFKHRKNVVAEMSSQYSFPIKHVEPMENPFPVAGYQRCVNTGIMNASGPIAFFTCDYTWLPPDCLSIHDEYHQKLGSNVSVFGSCHYVKRPALRVSFPNKYGLGELGMWKESSRSEVQAKWANDNIREASMRKWCDSYCQDLENGLLDSSMWSLFERPFSIDDNPLSFEVLHEETKKSMPEGFIQPQFCHLKNDSIPMDALLAVNGFDERYDGSHGWQDTEIACRMAARLGMQWYLKPDSVVHIVDVHDAMIIRRMLRPEQSNEQLYLADQPAGYPGNTNPHLNMNELHARMTET